MVTVEADGKGTDQARSRSTRGREPGGRRDARGPRARRGRRGAEEGAGAARRSEMGKLTGGLQPAVQASVLGARVRAMSAIDDLATELARLPGHRAEDRASAHLSSAASSRRSRAGGSPTRSSTLGERVRPCARCFNLTEEELCAICRDPRRDRVAHLRRRGSVGHRRDRARGRVPRASTTCSAAGCRRSTAWARRISPIDAARRARDAGERGPRGHHRHEPEPRGRGDGAVRAAAACAASA